MFDNVQWQAEHELEFRFQNCTAEQWYTIQKHFKCVTNRVTRIIEYSSDGYR